MEYGYQVQEDDIEVKLKLEDILSTANIATLIDEEQLKLIGLDCSKGYEIDLASRSDRDANIRLAQSFALGCPEHAEKNTPWAKAANLVYPIIAKAGIAFAERAYPAIVSDGKVVDVDVVGSDDGVPETDVNGQNIPDPASMQPIAGEDGQPKLDQMGQPMMQPTAPIWKQKPGDKEARGRRVSDYMNWQFKEEMENWHEDTDKLVHALPITGNMFRKVYWDADELKTSSSLVYPAQLVVNSKAPSIEKAPRVSEEIEYYPYEVIELIRSEIWLDGKYLTEDSGTQTEESERLSNLMSSKDTQTPHVFIEQLCRIDLDDDGYQEPYIVTFHKMSKTVVRITPNFLDDSIKKNGKIIRSITPETYYIHYPFIPSPDGSIYAMGFGELLLPTNKAINTLLNQLIDAGSLSNTSSGLIGRGLRMKGGTLAMTKGKFQVVDSRGGSIRENFVQIQHPEPSQTLFQLLGLMIDCAKDMAGLRDVLQGEQVANQAAMTSMALIEQGLTQFKAIHKRISQAISKEIKLVYRLNKIYLNDEEYANILDAPVPISRKDFDAKDFNIVPIANPYMVNDMQRFARLQYLDGLRGDPNINQEALRKEIFKLGGMDKLVSLIVPSPPPQEDPNIALQKSLVKVEEYKTQVRQQEAEAKAKLDGINLQMKVGEATHKSEMAEKDAQMKLEELQAQYTIKAQEIQLKSMEAQGKQAKTGAEISKINAEVDKITAETREIGTQENE